MLYLFLLLTILVGQSSSHGIQPTGPGAEEAIRKRDEDNRLKIEKHNQILKQ